MQHFCEPPSLLHKFSLNFFPNMAVSVQAAQETYLQDGLGKRKDVEIEIIMCIRPKQLILVVNSERQA